jgi:hypothetical protein
LIEDGTRFESSKSFPLPKKQGVLKMDKSVLQTANHQQLQIQETNEFKHSAYYKRFEKRKKKWALT